MFAAMHPEDVKAGIRKRYGSVAEFERKKGLPPKSVTDVLRGRAWRLVSEAIAAALQEDEPPHPLSEGSDNSAVSNVAHRLSGADR